MKGIKLFNSPIEANNKLPNEAGGLFLAVYKNKIIALDYCDFEVSNSDFNAVSVDGKTKILINDNVANMVDIMLIRGC